MIGGVAPRRLDGFTSRDYRAGMANILVTGTSRGIGKAIAASLSAHKVVGHSSRGGDGMIAADLSAPGAAGRLWEEALERLGGRIDALVNNAGIFEAADVDLPAQEWTANWERTMRVNLTASAELCRLAVLHFREAGGGRIVNVASRAAYRGDSPQHWHYAASKAGMIGMTKSIARGFAADGILAFAVCPGFTASEMVDDYMASRGGQKVIADIPLGRIASAEEVAETVRWLALDAPASATGAVIDVNGASYVR
ncbi:MAG: 3-oxoacyl-[acyl-carrier protein] reductase [Sphingomonadales bacterium]|nr:3-oxoacyl-[acyl-carrier protein] reductase [Sphingomonadales bacterium]